MYIKPVPVGVNPARKEDRIPLIKVINGDSWVFDFRVYHPIDRSPATPENSKVTFALTENRFSDVMYWQGSFNDGISVDENRPFLIHVKIPKEVSSVLRRGVYAFSVKVSDINETVSLTEAIGNVQVEYETQSDTHSIPYRDGSWSGDMEPIPVEQEQARIVREALAEFIRSFGKDVPELFTEYPRVIREITDGLEATITEKTEEVQQHIDLEAEIQVRVSGMIEQ